MPWILLGIVVILVQISVWGGFTGYRSSLAPSAADFEVTFQSGVTHPDGGYIELNVGCDDTLIKVFPQDVLSRLSDEDLASLDQEIDWELRRCAGLLVRESVRQEARERFVLPASVSNALGVGFNFGVVLIMILAASVIGSEYGWGTLRMTLAKGTGRWQLLTSKLILVLLVGAGGFIIIALTAAVSSLAAASLVADDGLGLADSGQWSTVAVMFGKAIYGLIPYLVLALFLTVLTSSSSMGIAISLSYYFTESILVGILGGMFDWFSTVTNFLLGPNIIAWMTEPEVQATGSDAALFAHQDLPSQLHAFLVVAGYMVIIATASFLLFQRKDIAGAKGE